MFRRDCLDVQACLSLHCLSMRQEPQYYVLNKFCNMSPSDSAEVLMSIAKLVLLIVHKTCADPKVGTGVRTLPEKSRNISFLAILVRVT